MSALILFAAAHMASLISGSTAATIEAQNAKRDSGPPCTNGGPWVTPTLVGAIGDQAGPNPICETHWGTDYDIITNITAWTDNVRIRGIQFGYSSDGPGSVSQVYGNQDVNSSTISLDPGEFFVSGTLWPEDEKGRKNSLRLGHIFLQTNTGKTLDVGKPKNQLGQARPFSEQEIGGGVLLGAVGTSGADINAMGLFFLNQPVISVSISNVTYNSNPIGTSQGIAPVALNQGHFYNNEGRNGSAASGNVTWNFTGSSSTTTSYKYMQGSSTKFGDSTTVSIDDKIFGIGISISNTFTWEQTSESAATISSSDTQSLSYGSTGSLLPGKGVDVQALAQKGEGNFPYHSNVTLSLKDGTSYSYNETGVLSNVQYSQTWSTVSENDSDDMPSGPTTPAPAQATGSSVKRTHCPFRGCM